MSLTIEQIEKQLTASLNQGHLAISSALLGEMQLGALPRWLVPASDLALEAAALERKSNTHLQIVGHYAHPNFGASSLVIDVNWLSWEAPMADVQLSLTAPVRLGDFIAKAGLAASGAIAKLADAVAVAGIASRRSGGTREIEISVVETLNIKIGPVEARLTLDELVTGIDPLTWREASGTLRFSGYELPARLPLSGSFSLQLTPQNLSVLDLIRTIGIALPPLPDIPALTKSLEGFMLESAPEGLRLSGMAPAPPLGKLRFVLAQTGGSYEAAIALDADSNLRFSSIISALKPLDALMSNVSFGSPAFVLSSATVPAFPLPTAEGKPGTLAVAKGATFQGELKLNGFGLDVLEGLLGTAKLPFTVPAIPDLSSVRLTAELDRKITVLGFLTTEKLKVSIALQPLLATVEGATTLKLGGATLPKFILGMSLEPTGSALYLRSAEPWKKPLGLPFDVNEVGLQLTMSPVVKYAVFGDVTLQKRKFAIATEFVGEVPTFLSAKLDEDFELATLLAELVGLPKPLLPPSVKIQNANLYLVVEPQGATVAGHRYPQGVGLSGTASFLGLRARVHVAGSQTRFRGEGALEQPILIKPVLEITGADGSGAPRLLIDSQGDPAMEFNGRISLLGIVQDIRGRVASEGIDLRVQQQVGPIGVSLDAVLAHGRLRAKGESVFGLKTSVGPIKVVDGGPTLGKIKVNGTCTARTILTVSEEGEVDMAVTASFNVMGIKISLPEIKLDTPAFDNIPQAVIDYVQRNAAALFAELLKIDNWLKAVAEGVIEGVEDVAHVLKEHFKKGAEEIARAMNKILKRTVEETVIALKKAGYTVEQIVVAMNGLTDATQDVTNEVTRVLINVLKVPAEPVAFAWRALKKPDDVVRGALNVAKVPGKVIEDVVRKLPKIPTPSTNPGHYVPRVRIRLRPPRIRRPRIRL